MTIFQKVSELDHEDSLFHFRINDMPTQVNNEISSFQSHRHRTKRHVENKIDMLRQDDRVELVFPQQYLIREKRSPIQFEDIYLNDYSVESSSSKQKIPMTKDELQTLENIYDSLLDSIEKDRRTAYRDAGKINSKNNPVDLKLNLPLRLLKYFFLPCFQEQELYFLPSNNTTCQSTVLEN